MLKCGFVLMQPLGTKYSLIRDGRRICPDCQKSAITNLRQLQTLIEEIQRFYEGLGMKVYEQFPFELVGLTELNVSTAAKLIHLFIYKDKWWWSSDSKLTLM